MDEGVDAQTLLNKIVLDYMREQTRKRRWRFIIRGFFILLLVWLTYAIFFESTAANLSGSKPHVGLINLTGEIFDNHAANADDFIAGMKAAYKQEGMKALILRIDSPGGSPVQADYMYNAIRYYQTQYPKIKIYAVCVDMCASAAYYIASAADEIYANPSSLVGSIGVLYNGFGFVDTLQKLGVSRRLQTAGKNKGFLDMFSPINPEQEKHLQTMLNLIHEQFINQVKQGRGKRLVIDDELFSGLFWTGIQAKQRGLIDGFASSGEVARDVIKIEKIINYTSKPSMLDRMSSTMGAAMMNQLPMALHMKPGLQ